MAGEIRSISWSHASAFGTLSPSVDIAIQAVNDAPSWSQSTAPMTPILTNAINPDGDLVSSIFGVPYRDVEGAPVSVAAVGSTGTGVWQYQRSGSSTWTPFGILSDSAAHLLDGFDRVRFVSAAHFAGAATLSVRAWDRTDNAAVAYSRNIGTRGDRPPTAANGSLHRSRSIALPTHQHVPWPQRGVTTVWRKQYCSKRTIPMACRGGTEYLRSSVKGRMPV